MNKPPIGLKHRWLVEEERLFEVSEAIKRFVDHRCEIPSEWLEEYNYLTGRMKARESNECQTNPQQTK